MKPHAWRETWVWRAIAAVARADAPDAESPLHRIARELAALGAPAELIDRADLAAAREHAGGEACTLLLQGRSAFELALDHARDTTGSLAHVELMHVVAAWLDIRLSSDERVAVRAARLDALEQVGGAERARRPLRIVAP